MAKYKIVKYKGKNKIKNTKTGKTVDIDIEKFMNGGYKTIYDSYKNGGKREKKKFVPKYGCGGLQGQALIDCQEQERKMYEAAGEINYNTDPNTGETLNSNYNITQQNHGLITEGNYNMPTDEELDMAELDDEIADLEEFNKDPELNRLAKKGKRLREKEEGAFNRHMYKTLDKEGYFDDNSEQNINSDYDYNIPNPYAGVDIPTAAFKLGQNIKNGNALGIVGSALKTAVGLGRNVVSGLGHQNRYNQVMKDYYKDQKKLRNQPEYFAYGGKKEEELLTGEYMRGEEDPNAPQVNAEVEAGEYFQSNEGDIAEVVGKKHSQGGERINMQPEDRVLSDKLTLGTKTAKMLASKYDLKLKAKNTYSDVIDKFKKKMKLDDMIEEEAMYLKKLEEQSKVEDQATRNLNTQVLSQKINELRQEKHPIEELRKEVFDDLFNIQEDSKPKDKKVNKTSKFEDGGKMLMSLADEYGIPYDRAKELIDSYKYGGKKEVPKYECGGDPNMMWDEEKQTCVPIKRYGKEAESHFLESYSEDPTYKYKDVKKEAERFKYLGNIYGMDTSSLDGENITQNDIDRFAGLYQKKVIETNPEIAGHYGINVAPTNQGLTYLLEKGLPKDMVSSILTKDGKVKRGTKESELSQEDISKITEWAKTNLKDNDLQEYGSLNFNDNKGYYRGADIRKVYHKDKGYYDNILKSENRLGKKFRSTDKTGAYIHDVLLQDKVFDTQEELDAFIKENKDRQDSEHDNYYSTEENENIYYNPILKKQEKDDTTLKKEAVGMMPYLFPDESPLPPSALQGTLKIEPRYDRVRSTEIDAEPYLQDIKDREEAQVQSLEGLSPNVRAAVLANMRANSQKAESQIRNQIDTQNLQSEQRAIYTNAQIQQREENARNRERLSYENRQYRAQALTDNDIRNYINNKQELNAERFMDIHNLNLVNATNEDVFFDGQRFRRKEGSSDEELFKNYLKFRKYMENKE